MSRNFSAPYVMAVFGTRPEAIKLAPVVLQLQRKPGWRTLVVATAQHREMMDQALNLFGITPDFDLDLMRPGQTVFEITSRVLLGLQPIFEQARPDLVLVQGDTTTVMAGALAAFYCKIPVGHVEAGLRTFDKSQPFPEEMNRKLTTALADLHFAPTELARRNLLAEGVPAASIVVAGNTAVDALLHVAALQPPPACSILDDVDPARRLVVVTTHRRENWGAPLREVCRAIRRLVEQFGDVEVLYALHLNPEVQSLARAELSGVARVRLLNAVDYGPWVQILKRAHMILTDSGGIQEEAPSLGKPVLVLRNVTERPEGLEAGTLKVVGTKTEVIFREAARLLTDEVEYRRMAGAGNPYGDGHAAERIVDGIARFFAGRHP